MGQVCIRAHVVADLIVKVSSHVLKCQLWVMVKIHDLVQGLGSASDVHDLNGVQFMF
jgi:hypothetical protein